MTTRLALNRWENLLLPGSMSYPRLFHADASDQILIYPSSLGHGYRQQILLRDDITLVIVDYTLTQDAVINVLDTGNCLKFEFRPDAGYSSFLPKLGLPSLAVTPAQRRAFEVEVIFKRPSLATYFQAVMERLTPQTQCTAEHALFALYQHKATPRKKGDRPSFFALCSFKH